MEKYRDIEVLRKKREGWVKSNKENNFEDGINNLLTELYPDNAHFLYELLQNAEDAGATEVSFELLKDKLLFKHNGRAFDAKDIEGITSIGQGTKKDDINQIGKFGVGFKAVFSYTQTPLIHSEKYHFKIEDLVVPIQIGDKYAENTYMEFPFNEPKKPSDLAFGEIKKGLDEIQENTLLFLKNIKSIKYGYQNKSYKLYLEWIDKYLVSITHTGKNETTKWLRFDKRIPDKEPLYVSVAFKLEKDKKTKIEYIIPIDGKVSIFFPAEKENSNLKFHIHAPFASTVARDSIKDLEENRELRDLISELFADVLEYIKKEGLLNFDFLRCLPLPDDNLSPFYSPIRKAIVEYFNSNDYVLTENSTYRPASKCYKGTKDLKSFIDIELLKNLINLYAEEPVGDIYWIKNPPQKNSREDKFLQTLAVKDFRSKEFIDHLETMAKSFTRNGSLGDLGIFINKSDEWFKRLYDYCHTLYENKTLVPYDLKKIIKLQDDSLNLDNKQCYFSDSQFRDYKIVKKSVYSKDPEDNAFLFLKNTLKVKEINEEERVKALLKDEYEGGKFPNEQDHLEHIKVFLRHYKNNKDAIDFFSRYKFIVGTSIQGACWCNANNIYIGEPFETNSVQPLNGISDEIYFLDKRYEQLSQNNLKLFLELLKELGAKYQLEIVGYYKMNDIYGHPQSSKMSSGNGSITKRGKFNDYRISDLDIILSAHKKDISLLVWKRVQEAKPYTMEALFKANAKSNEMTLKSSFICSLNQHKWIPDREGNFHKPQDISKEMLPNEFAYDDSNGWLTAINFGENIRKNHAEYKEKEKTIRSVTDLSLNTLEEAKRVGITDDDLKSLIREKEAKKLKDSLEANQSDGESAPFVNPNNNPTIITNDSVYEKSIHHENKYNTNKHTTSITSYKRQDDGEQTKIKEFLYKEYEGHCQICGDTFADGGKNIYKTKSLNVGKNRDVNRKGNSLSLCHKHHEIFKRNLQKNTFLESINERDNVDLAFVDTKFEKYDWVDSEDQKYINDSFYRLNKDDNFMRDEIYFLPIKLFGKEEFIKFTKAHILEFIEVWNNN